MTHEDVTQLLRREMAPALGCTGPTAYALAAARCRPHLTAELTEMTVYVSPFFLKIGFGVATPGTAEPGIGIAAAAGLLGGDYTLGLEVLRTATPETMQNARRLVAAGRVRVRCDWARSGVYVRVEAATENERVSAVVAGTHDGICSVAVDGTEVFHADNPLEAAMAREAELDLETIFTYVETADTGGLRFLLEGFRMNAALAEDGLRRCFGLCSGRTYLAGAFPAGQAPADLFEKPLAYLPASLRERVRILVSAASDARMGGSRLPALAAMWDGNQGITATLPVGLAAAHCGADEARTIRALALSCLMPFYVKLHVGRAAAFCLCAIAASAGAAAGVAYLNGLDRDRICAAVKNVIAPLAGMLCDGAKNACAVKMAVAADTALTGVELAAAGAEVGYFDGVADETLEETVACIAAVGARAQPILDRGMVDAILAKQARTAGS